MPLIGIHELVLDGQTRHCLRESVVQEYAELIEAGATLPKPVAFYDGKRHLLSTGFHRVEAHKRAGKKHVDCDVRKGSRWDAIEFGIKDNLAQSGERITNADKAHNVRLVLKEKPGLSDRAIAELCGVHHSTVSKYRPSPPTSDAPEKPRTGRDGKSYPMESRRLNPPTEITADRGGKTVEPPEEVEIEDEEEEVVEAVETPPPPPPRPAPSKKTDAVGGAIPKAIQPSFDRAGEFEQLGRDLHAVIQRLTALGAEPIGSFLHIASVVADIENAKNAIKFAKPYAVCPYCKGRCCKACRNTGWLPKPIYKAAPEDAK